MKKILILFLACILVSIMQTSLAASANYLDENKKTVIDFYNAAFNKLNFEEASAYLGEHYKQHSPMIADDREGLKNIIQFFRDKFPKTHVEIKRVFAEGNYVILQVHFVKQPGTLGAADMEIFRLENGKIVEHWGVSQEIPKNPVNSNGMF